MNRQKHNFSVIHYFKSLLLFLIEFHSVKQLVKHRQIVPHVRNPVSQSAISTKRLIAYLKQFTATPSDGLSNSNYQYLATNKGDGKFCYN